MADVFGIYFPPAESVYLVPVVMASGFQGRLRLDQPLNNQRKGIRFAADFEIDRWSHQDLERLVSGVRLRLVENLAEIPAA